MAEIVLERLSKVYPDGTEAVRSLDLEIPDGTMMVLVGPSGCGKTTVLRMIAGLERATRGTIRIGDRVVNDVAPKDRDLAMVFQNYALYPQMSVFENLAFSLFLRKVEKDERKQRVERVAGTLALADMLRKKPRQLSGGQRQRVAMGRAIVREPQAFLLDEPLSNLDAKLRVQIRTEILRIQRDLRVTSLYVTHDQTEAMTMGDKVAVMKKAQLQQVDDPKTLYSNPANIFVAGFIGSPAMNLVEATLARSNGSLAVEFGGQRLRVDDALAAERPGLAAYAGRTVALGIRPEAIEDASLVADGRPDARIAAEIDLTEAVGSDVYVHFTLPASPVLTEDTRELAVDAGAELLEELQREASEHEAPFVARVSPKTRARDGERVELAVDTSGLHFFDLETGESIR